MPFDTGIAERLRKVGLKVVEIDGWRTRGSSSFYPVGSVDHHTAGARSGNAPSLGICINGRAGLPGPLCNVLVGRDNTCYVIAAGRANHAGQGSWRGYSGNSKVYGVERENIGTTNEPWTEDQTHAAALTHAALLGPNGNPDLVCEHKEWAPGRKVDCHTITGANMRQRVRSIIFREDVKPITTKKGLEPMFYVIGYAGGGALWYFYPQTNRKSIATGASYEKLMRDVAAGRAPGYGGHLELTKAQVEGITDMGN